MLPPVTPAANVPLYQQIVEGVRRELAAGRLQAGQAMPSFRVLAESLHVGVITVQRAYAELEAEGILVCHPGLGTFIADEAEARIAQSNLRRMESLLSEAAQEGRAAGMNEAAFLEAARKQWHKREADHE